MRYRIIIFFISFFSISVNYGQSKKELAGIITYSLSYDAQMVDPTIISKMPKECEFTFRGNQTKMEMPGAELRQVRFTDGDNKIVYDYLYIYGELYGAIKRDKRMIEIEMAKVPPPNIELTNETKRIQGLICRKGMITFTDPFGIEYKSEFFYHEFPGAEDINFHNEFRDVHGLLMEFQIVSQGYMVKFVATKFKKKRRLKDKYLEMPKVDEYTTLQKLNRIYERGIGY